MADVSRPRGRRPDGERRESVSTASHGRDRGQLLLVGALALAVLFIALALLLNTAIYTGTLATRDAGGDATPAVEYVSASQDAGVDAVRSVNHRNNTSAADLNRAFTDTMDRWDDLTAHHRAVRGVIADANVTGITNGTRIQQDDASRDFASSGDAPNWTVADGSGVTAVRSMRFTVDESTLTPIDGADNATTEPVFRVDVTSGAEARSAYVYSNDTSGDPEVLVVDGSNETVCPAASDGTFALDIPNASVGGEPCPALEAVDDAAGDLSVAYGNGDAAGGTYTMVVDAPPSALSPSGSDDVSGLNDSGSGSPYWTDAIYGAEFDVTYRTAEIDYEATIEVVPQ